MGKFGWHSGYVRAQNIQSGLVDITTNSNGDGTASITFPAVLKSAPILIGTANEQDITGTVSFTDITTVSATIVVDGSSVTSGTLSVGWILMDYSA